MLSKIKIQIRIYFLIQKTYFQMKYLKLFSFLLMLILLGNSCGSEGNESDNNQKEGISKSEMTKPKKDKFQPKKYSKSKGS